MSCSSRRVASGAGAALGLALLAGCGNPYRTAEVRGKVTACDGKPATGGLIVFEPIDDPAKTGRPAGNPGRGSQAAIAADGTFALVSMPLMGQTTLGALVGPHQVKFTLPATERPQLTAEDRKTLLETGGSAAVKAEEERLAKLPVYPKIPCGNKVEPGQVEVKPGVVNEFTFTLPPK